MKRYYKATMDYRPLHEHSPHYYCVDKTGTAKMKDVKEYFKSTYSWLKLYECVEITREEYLEWVEIQKKALKI